MWHSGKCSVFFFKSRSELEINYSKGLQKIASKLLKVSKEMCDKWVTNTRHVSIIKWNYLWHQSEKWDSLAFVVFCWKLLISSLVLHIRWDVLLRRRSPVWHHTEGLLLSLMCIYINISLSEYWETLSTKTLFRRFVKS